MFQKFLKQHQKFETIIEQKHGGITIKDFITLSIRKFIHELGVYLFTEPNYDYLKRLFSRFAQSFGIRHLEVCCVIFLGAYMVGLLWERRKRDKTIEEHGTKVSIKTVISAKAFCLAILLTYYYILILYTVIFRPTYTSYRYQLGLFWSYKRAMNGDAYLYYEIVLNYLLLFPVGLLLYLLLPRKQPHPFLLAILIIGFSSAAIEVSQLLLRRGLFEFDDILGNVLGGILGYGLCASVRRCVGRVKTKSTQHFHLL